MDLEKDIEQYLRKQVEKLGGWCLKITPPPEGIPDRLVLLPGGRSVWVELKRPGGQVRATQALVHKRLQKLGQDVFVVWCRADVDDFIKKFEKSL